MKVICLNSKRDLLSPSQINAESLVEQRPVKSDLEVKDDLCEFTIQCLSWTI